MSEESMHPVALTANGDVVRLVTEKMGEAEIAADLKARLSEAFKPLLEIMDEANAHRLIVQWDAVGPVPPLCKNGVVGLRLVKHY